jgi:uncharacterized membrane protein
VAAQPVVVVGSSLHRACLFYRELSMKQEKSSDHDKYWRLILIGLGLILFGVVFGLYFYYFHGYPVSDNPSDWGVFGDYIGGLLNPTVALLALLALLRSMWQQHRQVEKTIKEMRDNSHRDELFRLIEWTMSKLDERMEDSRLDKGPLNKHEVLKLLEERKTAKEVQTWLTVHKSVLQDFETSGGNEQVVDQICKAYTNAEENLKKAAG